MEDEDDMKQQQQPTDHLHLMNQVAHHDAAIGALGSRMSGVENTLGHMQERLMTLDNKVSAGFGSLESAIRENKAASGPSLGEMLKGVATGGAIVAMSAGAITMLVTSFVKPDIVQLQSSLSALKEAEAQRDRAEHQELVALQERRRQMIDEAIGKVNDWRTETRKGGL